MELHEALNLARAAKAIDSENRDVPENAALVVLAREIDSLRDALRAIIAHQDWPCCRLHDALPRKRYGTRKESMNE